MSEKPTGEQQEKALKTLGTMLDYLGLEASIKPEPKGTKLMLNVSSDEAGRIIGRKGAALESLQLLINRMMQKGDQDFPQIIIDVDGYSRKPSDRGGRRRGGDRATKEQLTQQALDAAKEVKRWGEPISLPPMNAHDRRLIHITLREDQEIETESHGEGRLKKVVIKIKGA